MENLHWPITIFDVEDFGVSRKRLREMQPAFYELPWDYYDLRKSQLDFLECTVGSGIWGTIERELAREYFVGSARADTIERLISDLNREQRLIFDSMRPFRKRSASRFIYTKTSTSADWHVKRVPMKEFTQGHGAVLHDQHTDYRKYPRSFTETTTELATDPVFRDVLLGVANLTAQALKRPAVQFDLTAHHTYVEATAARDGDNSPEGIHQDGYDYIVSALVMERRNIVGGMSRVFQSDKISPILTATLRSGQGILQPDKGTSLWHDVTSFSVLEAGKVAFRTSIGIDIRITDHGP